MHGDLPPHASRLVRVCEADGPAVVLGSTQPLSVVRAGSRMPVVRRRSGGGAVWVAPGEPVWVDVVVPSGDPLWVADVGRSFWWLGEAWAAALTALGLVGGRVHQGALIRTPLSAVVCFAGLGPGEVTVDGRKVVGLAQRRTREAAVFQCAVPRRWDPAPLVEALVLPVPADEARAELARAVTGVGDVTVDDVVTALLDHLP